MRRRRLPPIISGRRRSSGVIELIIASTRFIPAALSTCPGFILFLTAEKPGIMSTTCPSGPIFLSC